MSVIVEKLNLDYLDQDMDNTDRTDKKSQIALIDRYTLNYYGDDQEIDLNSIVICTNMKISLMNSLIDNEIVDAWNQLEKKPNVIVFDLDLTLWPFWIDSHVSVPFRKIQLENDDQHMIVDSDDRILTYYSDVPKILNTLKNYCLSQVNGYMAIASRTSEYDGAKHLIELLGWDSYFNSYQMYSGSKRRHLNQICDELNILNKQDILFFDDDDRNIITSKELGITSILVNRKYGLTVKDCVNGLKEHESKLM